MRVAAGAHLVGSVPLPDAEAVFRTVGGRLGERLRSLPDGETGTRKDWIAWQYGVLASTPGLEPAPPDERAYLRKQLVRRRPGSSGALRLGSLGYAKAARESYALFERLQREGAIPARVRFQVSLPTPLAPVSVFVDLPDRAIVELEYEAAMLRELAEITAAIPHERLAVQWDVAAEIGHLEGLWPAHFTHVERGVVERLFRIGSAVPRDVWLGYHLCYGDFGHRHFVTPSDAGKLVELANALVRGPRPIAWVHMPVPLAWRERAAYEPLRRLALPEDTRLYLGVVHHEDGARGAWERIALAREVAPEFGIGTECGWGRRPPDTVDDLLTLHAALAGNAR